MMRLSISLFLIGFVIRSGAAQVSQSPVRIVPVPGNSIDIDIYGRIYVLDEARCTLRLYSKDGTFLREMGGQGWDNDRLDKAVSVWAKDGMSVYIADYGNHRIQRYDRSLDFVASFSTRDDADPGVRFGYPAGVALSRQGELYLTDGENTRVLKVSGFSTVERAFGGIDAGKGRLLNPSRLEIGPKDNLYVLDGDRVVVFDSFGNYLREIGGGPEGGGMVMCADDAGLLVLDKSRLMTFDGEDRLRGTLPRQSVCPDSLGPVRGMVASLGRLHLLTGLGVYVIPDPRTVAENALTK